MNALIPTDPANQRSVNLFEREDQIGLVANSFRREVRAKPFRLYMAVVIASASLYYGVLAAPLYVSTTQFAIRSKDPLPTVPLLAALTGTVQAGLPESTALSNYIQSPDMLAELDKVHHLRALYSKPRLDFVYWMPADASQQAFLRFYNGMVSVDLDTDANLVTVTVKSFDAQSAYGIANSALNLSSAFVDNLSREMRDESIKYAKQDFDKAQADDVTARKALADFRAATGDLDPAAYGTGAASALLSMQTQVVSLHMQLAAMETYSKPNAPQVQQLQAQITKLQQEMAEGQAKLAGQDDKNSINHQLNQFQGLSMKQGYADSRLVLAQGALDQAKSEADQRELFVVPVTRPAVPDRAALPLRLLGVFNISAVAALLYAISRFVLASIKDHQEK